MSDPRQSAAPLELDAPLPLGRASQLSLVKRAEKILAQEIQYIQVAAAWSGPTHGRLASQLGADDILSADEEVSLFRDMNGTKRRASQLRSKLSLEAPSPQLMEEIEDLLDLALQSRNGLVLVFLKLGAAISRSLANPTNPAEELLSEASMTLIRAVDCFDCERGFRFSTYATHAIRRNLIRHLKTRRKRTSVAVPLTNLDDVLDDRKWTWSYQQQVSRATSTVDRLMRQLKPREQYILRSRYGLGDSLEAQSLQSIANRLGVSRERIRQLECRATNRLRLLAKEQNLELMEA